MYEILKGRTREVLKRYLGNQRGQTEVVTWLIILVILWYMLSSARLTLQ